jgi:hypothetical protein
VEVGFPRLCVRLLALAIRASPKGPGKYKPSNGLLCPQLGFWESRAKGARGGWASCRTNEGLQSWAKHTRRWETVSSVVYGVVRSRPLGCTARVLRWSKEQVRPELVSLA